MPARWEGQIPCNFTEIEVEMNGSEPASSAPGTRSSRKWERLMAECARLACNSPRGENRPQHTHRWSGFARRGQTGRQESHPNSRTEDRRPVHAGGVPRFNETKMVPEGILNRSRFVTVNPATSEKNAFDQSLERRPTGEQLLNSHEAGTDRNRCRHNQRRYSRLLEPR